MSGIETWSIDRVLMTKFFLEKICGRYAPDTSSRPLLNFVDGCKYSQ